MKLNTLKLYKKMILIVVSSLCCVQSFSYAGTSYHGDSVMTPGNFSTAPLVLSGQSKATGNQYTSTNITEYQTGVCPAGLTFNGSSIYNSAQRTITSTYLGSQLVGTTISGWTDTDSDCIGYQYQTIACPAGYTGSITQQQKLSTGVGGLVGGDWETISNACVSIPPSPICIYSSAYRIIIGNTSAGRYPNFDSYITDGYLYIIINGGTQFGGAMHFSSANQIVPKLQSVGINIGSYVDTTYGEFVTGDNYSICLLQSLIDSLGSGGYTPY